MRLRPRRARASRRRHPRDARTSRADRSTARAGLAPRQRDHADPGSRRRGVTARLTTRVLLADDHAVVRRGIRMVLEAEPDLTVVAEAGDGAEAVEAALGED